MLKRIFFLKKLITEPLGSQRGEYLRGHPKPPTPFPQSATHKEPWKWIGLQKKNQQTKLSSFSIEKLKICFIHFTPARWGGFRGEIPSSGIRPPHQPNYFFTSVLDRPTPTFLGVIETGFPEIDLKGKLNYDLISYQNQSIPNHD